MEKKIRSAFDGLTMPDECANRIKNSFCEPTNNGAYCAEAVAPGWGGWLKGIATAALLLLMVSAGIVLRPSVEDLNYEETASSTESLVSQTEQNTDDTTVESTVDTPTEGILDEKGILDPAYAAVLADIQNGLRYTEGNITYTYSGGLDDLNSGTFYDTRLHTPWTEIIDGKVIFTANGESIDITGQFSEEEPFTYIYTDSHYISHYIAIGGTIDHPGYLEMCKICWETEPDKGSLGGFGVNTWNYETESRFGWEQQAKDIFLPYGIYWAS